MTNNEERNIEVGDYLICYKDDVPISRHKIIRVTKRKACTDAGVQFSRFIDEGGQVRCLDSTLSIYYNYKIQTHERLVELKRSVEKNGLVEYIKSRIDCVGLEALRGIKKIVEKENE
jgi:hypothetical protein